MLPPLEPSKGYLLKEMIFNVIYAFFLKITLPIKLSDGGATKRRSFYISWMLRFDVKGIIWHITSLSN